VSRAARSAKKGVGAMVTDTARFVVLLLVMIGALCIRRREFITLVGSTAAWPLAARAQQPALPVIGLAGSGTATAEAPYVALFRKTLNEAGYFEGRNVAIEFRWADARAERIPALVADLVRRRVSVIFAMGGLQVALPAKRATAVIPIVFAVGGDPVEAGLVESLNHPGGNLTGATVSSNILIGKQVEVLRKLVPSASEFAFLFAEGTATAMSVRKQADEAARALNWKVTHFGAMKAGEFDAIFQAMGERGIRALLVQDQSLFSNNREQLAVLAARHRIAGLYIFRSYPEAGSFASYGPSATDNVRQASIYVVRILKGEKPADLPVMLPTKYELVMNLKTAKAIGLDIPPTMLALADEVIE
jgi:putative ABC transport system substrate-binding protein